MKERIKKIGSAILAAAMFLSVMFILSSCGQSRTSIYNLIAVNEPAQALIMIVNNPKEDVVSKVEVKKSLTLGQDGNRAFVIPKYENSVLEIFSIKAENGSYTVTGCVYSNRLTEKDFVLDLSVVRSDENPQYKIVVRTPTDYAEYILFAEKGVDESFEYVISDLGTPRKTDRFSYNEVGYLFSQGSEYIKSVYGTPTSTKTVELFETSTATQMYFNKTSFEIDNTDNSVFHAKVYDDKIPHPRGIKIGDSLPIVLSRFPNGNDGQTVNFDKNDVNKGDYALLYGEYAHMQNYGYIHYVDDVVTEVVYSNQGAALILAFENNRVTSIEYSIPMT